MAAEHVMQQKKGTSRRDFLRTSAAGAAAFGAFFTVRDAEAITGENLPDPVVPGAGENIVYRFSNCQNCHSRCGIMAKIVGPAGSTDPAAGVCAKIEGNPYHPNNMGESDRLYFNDTTTAASAKPGTICPKGQAGIQVLYNPYRIKQPLRRVGARGSGKWQAIPWSTALSEIATKINTLIPVGSRLTTPIDPAKPELGPIANHLCFSPGRTDDKEIIERVFKNTWGTANYRLDHTSICETSHHVADELMTWPNNKHHAKPDIDNSEYLIDFGGNWVEANFPMVALSRKLADFKKRPGTKFVCVDPRFSNTAAKADVWLPAKPATDGAVALAIASRILERIANNDLGAANSIAYLKSPNNAVATASTGDKTYTDSTHLVVVGRNAAAQAAGIRIGQYADMGRLGLGTAGQHVCWAAGAQQNAATYASPADLFPGAVTVVSGGISILCKTVLELVREEILDPYAPNHVAHYAGISGLDAGTLLTIADEFLAKGRKAVANPYRGTVQHSNGLQAMKAVQLVNQLVGNMDWKGGNQWGGSKFNFDSGMKGSASSGPLFNGSTKFPQGPRIDRASAYKLQGSTTGDFNDWYVNDYGGALPSPRPWGPYWTHGNYQEAFLGIAQGYPYSCKVLITYWNAWPYSTPALKDVFLNAIQDESRIPLYVNISTTMGEAEAYADYILPDGTYLEQWTFAGTTPTILSQFTNFRQPIVGSFDGKAWDAAFSVSGTNNYTPVYPEVKTMGDTLLLLMAELGLTADIDGNPLPANAWAQAKIGIDNLGLPTTGSFRGDATDWRDAIVARGGAFADPVPASSYSGNYVRKTYGKHLYFYTEQIATMIDTMKNQAAADWVMDVAGQPTDSLDHFADVKKYALGNPLPAWQPDVDIADNPITDLAYPFQLITYKTVLHGQARTIDLPWLAGIEPENFVWINPADAGALGIRTYDNVRLTSATNAVGVVGRALVTEGIRPGVLAVSHHYGHWEHSSKPHTVDGAQTGYDASRAMGIGINPILRLDPVLSDICVQEKIGGSCSFSSRVQIQKV